MNKDREKSNKIGKGTGDKLQTKCKKVSSQAGKQTVGQRKKFDRKKKGFSHREDSNFEITH